MGLISKLKGVLSKTKDNIGKKLVDLFAKNKLGDEFYDDLEELLISADVSVQTSMEIVENIRDVAIDEKCKDKDYVVDILKQELIETLLSAEPLEIKTPAIFMMIGVNGAGKTTTVGKLANLYNSQKRSVTIAAADTFRAAASEQLKVWADRAKVRIVSQGENSDPSAVVFDAVSSAKAKNTDVLIIDTAGRLHVKSNLMEELKKMDRVVNRVYPEANFYKLIVLDSTTGQNSYNQTKAFDEAVGIDGIVLTKLDGTAKGGFIISLSKELGVPVCFVGTGEKIDDIAEFDAEEFVDAMF